MDAVFALADRVSVLVEGQVIASGSPAAVRADPAVRAAYLGDETVC
jgi:branched-chain amino acid transport system ATP-binding protein